jgi:DNA-binding MarR family transcriptional regulator
MYLLREGGRTGANEIAKVLNMGQSYVGAVCQKFADRGYAVRFERAEGEKALTFGVTPNCKIPREVTLRDVLATNTSETA